MAIFYTPRIEINGVIDTNQPVLSNINEIATASQSFITWDPIDGLWKTILNRPVNYLSLATKNFNDSNIIGSINISGSGVDQMYNSVGVSYRHKDLEDELDYIEYSIPLANRFSNEVDNQLKMSFDIINDPVQAGLIANIELKQSRMDQIIQFKTDFTSIGLRAGEVITVTNTPYSFTNKPYRIIKVEEIDDEDGALILQITGLEYSDDVYDDSGLVRKERNKNTGIVPKENNVCVQTSDDEDLSNRIANSLNSETGRDNLTQDIQLGDTTVSIPLFQTESLGWNAAAIASAFGSGTTSSGYLEAIIRLYRPAKTLYFNFEAPQGDVVFSVDSVNKNFTSLGIPCVVFVEERPLNTSTGVGVGSYVTKTTRYMEWSSYFTQISLSSDAPAEFRVTIQALNTYDLSSTVQLVTFISSSNYIPNANGDYATLNVAAFLN